MDTLATPYTLPSLPLSLGASLLHGLPLKKAQAQATLYLIYFVCHNLYPYGARYLSKKSADAEPEAKAALLYKAYGYAGYSSPYTYGYSAYLTPMVATPMLMVPDMVHTPTWDKMFTIPSMQSIHTELKLSVMARGLLMLPSCMELMAMLPPTTMVATLTLMVPST